MTNLLHKMSLTAALAAIPATADAHTPYQWTVFCDTADHFSLKNARQHNFNDDPVPGCRPVATRNVEMVEENVAVGIYAKIGRAKVNSQVGYVDQEYVDFGKKWLAEHKGEAYEPRS